MTEKILKKTAAGNYKAASVKKYVQEIKDLYDRDFDEQRDRMISLRDENKRLREEVGVYRQKEGSISAAVVKAEQVAEKIIAEAEVVARKKIAEADDFEKKAKRLVDSYIGRLYAIEKNIAELLKDAIHTTSSLKESGIVEEVNEAYGDAAEIYHMLSSLGKSEREAEEPKRPIAV
jgi:SMC interacting uncharacterized protein involved in chromosome segregation